MNELKLRLERERETGCQAGERGRAGRDNGNDRPVNRPLITSASGNNYDRHIRAAGEIARLSSGPAAVARLDDDTRLLVDDRLGQHRELEWPQPARHEAEAPLERPGQRGGVGRRRAARRRPVECANYGRRHRIAVALRPPGGVALEGLCHAFMLVRQPRRDHGHKRPFSEVSRAAGWIWEPIGDRDSERDSQVMNGSGDRRARVDLMGEASFPASDPPAVWTWDCASTHTASGVFDEVVVGADGTAASQLALRLATRLRADDARLLAVSVADVQGAWRTGLEAGNWMDWLRAAAEEVGREALHQLKDIPNATARVAEGRPADVLLTAVRSRHADLLAIGAGSGNRALGLVFGSTATRLARECPCSVLVARGDVHPERFPRRIVVGVDGSPQAVDAQAVGRVLAGSSGGQLRRLVATGGESLDPLWIDAEIDDRAPVEALTDASREADLLIVGSRGLRGVKALGSVAERVAHRAACPVLIVRFR